MDVNVDDLVKGIRHNAFRKTTTNAFLDEAKTILFEEKQPITILHLADIRYGWKGPRNLYEDAHKQAWQALINTFRDNVLTDISKPNFVTISGDVAYSGIEQEYEQCNREFITPLLETLGISKDYLLTCPGNHDVDIELDSEDRYIPEKGIPIVGQKRRFLSKERFEKISEKFHNYSSSFFDSSGLSTLVYTRKIEDIAFLSLNSAWYSSYYDKADGNLLIGKEACKDQVEFLHDEYYKRAIISVVLIHHPLRIDKRGFGWFHMEESEPNMTTMQEPFTQCVEDSAYIVLTGSPVFEQNVIPDPHGKCIVSCGITRGNKESEGEYSYTAALVEIHNPIVTVKILKYDLFKGGEYWELKADNFKFYQDSPIQMKRKAELLERLSEYFMKDPNVTVTDLRNLWLTVRDYKNVSESLKNKLYERAIQQWKQTTPDEDIDIDYTSERESRTK